MYLNVLYIINITTLTIPATCNKWRPSARLLQIASQSLNYFRLTLIIVLTLSYEEPLIERDVHQCIKIWTFFYFFKKSLRNIMLSNKLCETINQLLTTDKYENCHLFISLTFFLNLCTCACHTMSLCTYNIIYLTV